MVKDIRRGPLSSQVFSITNVGGTLFFTADDGIQAPSSGGRMGPPVAHSSSRTSTRAWSEAVGSG